MSDLDPEVSYWVEFQHKGDTTWHMKDKKDLKVQALDLADWCRKHDGKKFKWRVVKQIITSEVIG